MSDNGKGIEDFTLPVEWVVPEDLKNRYASNLIIQHDNHVFYLSFFELAPPILIGTPDEIAEQVDKIDSVKSECVARIIVSPERMASFIKAMQANLERYEAKHDSDDD